MSRALQAVMLAPTGSSPLLDLLGDLHVTITTVTGWDRFYEIFLPQKVWAQRIAARLRKEGEKRTVTFEMPSGAIYRVTPTGADRIA